MLAGEALVVTAPQGGYCLKWTCGAHVTLSACLPTLLPNAGRPGVTSRTLALFPTPTTAGHGISTPGLLRRLGLTPLASPSFLLSWGPFSTFSAAMSMLCSPVPRSWVSSAAAALMAGLVPSQSVRLPPCGLDVVVEHLFQRGVVRRVCQAAGQVEDLALRRSRVEPGAVGRPAP